MLVSAADRKLNTFANIIVRAGFQYVEANVLSGFVWTLEILVGNGTGTGTVYPPGTDRVTGRVRYGPSNANLHRLGTRLDRVITRVPGKYPSDIWQA